MDYSYIVVVGDVSLDLAALISRLADHPRVRRESRPTTMGLPGEAQFAVPLLGWVLPEANPTHAVRIQRGPVGLSRSLLRIGAECPASSDPHGSVVAISAYVDVFVGEACRGLIAQPATRRCATALAQTDTLASIQSLAPDALVLVIGEAAVIDGRTRQSRSVLENFDFERFENDACALDLDYLWHWWNRVEH